MALRILCVKGISNYDHLRTFVEYFRQAFIAQGCDVHVVDLGRPNPAGHMKRSLEAFKPDVVFSVNAQGGELHKADQAIASEDLPWFTYMVDEPYFHHYWLPFLRNRSVQSSWPSLEFRAHAERLQMHDPKYIPLAGRSLPLCRPEERTIDILFAGAIGSPDKIRAQWQKAYSPQMVGLILGLAEEWESGDMAMPVHEAFDRLIASRGIVLPPESAQKAEEIVAAEANRYVRNKWRLHVLRELSDLPITLHGDGWRELLPKARFTFKPSIPFYQFEEEISRSKLLLNVQPVTPYCISERSFGALFNGCVLAINENGWIDTHFDRGNEFLSYSLRNVAALRAEIERCLTDEPVREAMVQRARARAAAHHSWNHRAREILALLGATPPSGELQ